MSYHGLIRSSWRAGRHRLELRELMDDTIKVDCKRPLELEEERSVRGSLQTRRTQSHKRESESRLIGGGVWNSGELFFGLHHRPGLEKAEKKRSLEIPSVSSPTRLEKKGSYILEKGGSYLERSIVNHVFTFLFLARGRERGRERDTATVICFLKPGERYHRR